MVKLVFVQPDNTRQEVDSKVGETVKDAAIQHLVPGIEAECGGACACSTCHVIVAPEWFEKVGPPAEFEDEMLVIVDDRTEHSRLGCQIDISEELNGLVVNVPASQGS